MIIFIFVSISFARLRHGRRQHLRPDAILAAAYEALLAGDVPLGTGADIGTKVDRPH
jgi:hypothetical protein